MKKLVFLFFLLIVSQALWSQKSNYYITNGYVADGYDVVSYFSNSPLLGNPEFSTVFDGVKFKFSSKENLNLFKTNPQKYSPKYGGYCAYAVGKTGEKVSVDPKSFRIYKDQLFLFYKTKKYDTLQDWLKDENHLFLEAEKNWIKLKH
ncbi:hypothetical protein EGI22_19970 [Lacihabitans sp. LS3-19]|uniref:YHS domain-containing (seleno)protein n=1 Tax=Lacihabitans sp. LS3-19 TaxID=2487335 RepID=UPI0020CBDD08|nr:YHS domain-containing (seleno)protein [Lacihabitans sp. LS3-19]MCP9770188.1 hypothetical protein [Lacihabitans sp. LS3-19]